jgi:hypothetical protein
MQNSRDEPRERGLVENLIDPLVETFFGVQEHDRAIGLLAKDRKGMPRRLPASVVGPDPFEDDEHDVVLGETQATSPLTRIVIATRGHRSFADQSGCLSTVVGEHCDDVQFRLEYIVVDVREADNARPDKSIGSCETFVQE